MTPKIHPTAIVDSAAELSGDVTVGAYSIITGPVNIGPGTVINPHSHIQGKTVIGRACVIGPTAFVGLPPQHLRADPEIGQTIIGDRVTIREIATVHRSTAAGDDHATRVGDDCFIMGGVHIGHDCVLEQGVIMANDALLGGHCHIYPKAFLGGGCAIHQFVRIGRLAIVSGAEPVTQDIPPFASCRYGGLKAYNAIGCKRDGWSQEAIRAVRAAYRCLHTQRTVSRAIGMIRETVPDTPEVRELLEFIAASKRGIAASVAQRSMAGRASGGEEN